MNKFLNKIIEVNDYNFNLFVYLVFILLIIDTLTNNFLSSIGINKTSLLIFLGVSATIKIYFKIKDKVIFDSDTIKKTSLRRGIIILSKFIKKNVRGRRVNFIVVLIIICTIFLYQKSTQQVITYLTQAGLANYVVYGILITLYILIAFTIFHEKKPREANK